jgi:hypothetical protein
LGRLILIIACLVLLPWETLAQNNPFSPLRIWVPDSGIFIINFKSAGDITGDSIVDYTYLVRSEFGNPPPQEHVLRGGLPLDTIPIYNFPPGCNIAKADDLNGDALTDFVMTQGGQLYALWGIPSGIDTIPSRLLSIPNLGCGPIVPNVDVNGDSYHDLLILSNSQDSGNTAYLFKGNLNGIDTLPSWKVSTPRRSPSAIRELAAMDAGDLNNDGYADILVGKRAAFDLQDSISGLVEIYMGGPDSVFDTIPDFIMNSPSFNTTFGAQIKFAGDLNADQWPEWLIGDLFPICYLYRGASIIPSQHSFSFTCNALDVGDVNGDAFSDLMLGHVSYPAPFGFGAVIFLLGGPDFDSSSDAIITDQDLPPDFLENIGRAVGFIGDINGDSAEEFMFLADRIIPANRHEVFLFAGNNAVKTGVEDGGRPPIPRSFELFQNYPNPFNSTTLISYTLSRRAQVRLEVFNIAGQLVKVLVDGEQAAGEHRVSWGGEDSKGRTMPSGIYLYKLSIEGNVQVKKMVLVK